MMENNTVSYRELGGWLMVIFIAGLLNAAGDAVILLQKILKSWGPKLLLFRIVPGMIAFSDIFVNTALFFIAMPLTLMCNVLCLMFIGIRKLSLFKVFFFSACIIALVHLMINMIIIYPRTIFDGFMLADINPLIAGIIESAFALLKKAYPVFLISGTILMLGILFVCFLYFKRSKRIAVYFGSNP